jgi:hypothetical protein
MRPALLTPTLQERIVASLRAGGFPQISAQAWGVSPRTYRRWMRRGEGRDPIEPYRSFAAAVREATAQARLRAEMDIFENQPRIWLQHGPGRETDESPGWTTAVKPNASRRRGSNAIDEIEFGRLGKELLDHLKPFPEAHRSVAGMLEAKGCRNRDSKRKRRKP